MAIATAGGSGRNRPDRLQTLGALRVALDPGDLRAIEDAVPKHAAAGERYNRHAMAELDSGRRRGT